MIRNNNTKKERKMNMNFKDLFIVSLPLMVYGLGILVIVNLIINI